MTPQEVAPAVWSTRQAFVLLAVLYLKQSLLRYRSVILLVLVAANALLASLMDTEFNPAAFESHMFEVGFGFILPAICLLLGVGVIRDELEAGTLGYLLTRPLSRFQIYASRLTIASMVAAALAVINGFAVSAFLPVPAITSLPQVLLASVVGALVFTSLFAAVGTFFSRPFLVGLGWLIGAERILATVPFDGRFLAVSPHLMSVSGLSQGSLEVTADLPIHLAQSVSPMGSWLFISILCGVCLVAGVWAFHRGQYAGELESV